MKKRWWFGGLVLFATGAWAQCKRQALDIPVQIVNQRPIVNLTVEGAELRMLLDTGAFHSMLMPSTAEQLQLPLGKLPAGLELHGYTGRIEAKLTKAKEVRLQGLPFKNMEFVVGGNELGSGIQGILGRNFLRGTDIEYDLGHGRMRLHVRTGDCDGVHPVYWADGVPVIESRLETDPQSMTLFVRALVNGRAVTALMDSGAPITTLALRAARRAGVEREALVPVGRTGGAGAGSAQLWQTPLQSFELGGQKIENIRVHVSETRSRDHDMLLGLDYFLSHRIYVSRSGTTLYATWNGGPVFSTGSLAREGDAEAGALAPSAPSDDPDALARVAAATASRGDLARALEQFNRVLALAPAAAEHHVARARVLQGLRRSKEALADLDEALRLDSALHSARLLRVQLLAAGKREPERLADDLAQLDQTLPPIAHERLSLGHVYAQLGQLPEALKQWALWLPTRSEDRARADVFHGRCWLRTRLNQQLDEAMKDCEAALDVDPRVAAYHVSFGWLHLRRGDATRARKAFARALELNERQAFALYGRAMAQRQLGDTQAAEQDFAGARSLMPRVDAAVAEAGLADLVR